MYGCSTALLRVWQCLLIAPVTRRRPEKSAGDADEYAFSGSWYALNLCATAACAAGGAYAVLNDARTAKAGRGSLRMQNKSSAVVTVLQVTLQCMVCVTAVCRSAGRHRVLCEIGRRLRAADAALGSTAAAAATGRPRPAADDALGRPSLLLVALHAALYAVDCHSWYAISPVSWMYFVCYAYLSVGLAAMLMYAQVAWNIGRRFERVNAAVERRLRRARAACADDVRKDYGGGGGGTACLHGRPRKFPVAPTPAFASGGAAAEDGVTGECGTRARARGLAGARGFHRGLGVCPVQERYSVHPALWATSAYFGASYPAGVTRRHRLRRDVPTIVRSRLPHARLVEMIFIYLFSYAENSQTFAARTRNGYRYEPYRYLGLL